MCGFRTATKGIAMEHSCQIWSIAKNYKLAEGFKVKFTVGEITQTFECIINSYWMKFLLYLKLSKTKSR
jgi:hypothetical protein